MCIYTNPVFAPVRVGRAQVVFCDIVNLYPHTIWYILFHITKRGIDRLINQVKEPTNKNKLHYNKKQNAILHVNVLIQGPICCYVCPET